MILFDYLQIYLTKTEIKVPQLYVPLVLYYLLGSDVLNLKIIGKKLDRKIPQLTLNSLRQKSPFGINDGSKDIGSKLERFMCPSILSEPKIYPNIIYIVNY